MKVEIGFEQEAPAGGCSRETPLILDDESVQTAVAEGQISPLLGPVCLGLVWFDLT